MKSVIMITAALILIGCSKPTGPDDLLNPVSTVVKTVVKGAIQQ